MRFKNKSYRTSQYCDKMLKWLKTSMEPVCHICKEKTFVINSSMWSLSYCQMSPRAYLKGTIISPYDMISFKSMALGSSTPYPDVLHLLQELLLKTEKWRTLRTGSIISINCNYNLVSRSTTYIMIVNVNHYKQKWLILESSSIAFPRRNTSPILNVLIRP